jgi:hypothetical protein
MYLAIEKHGKEVYKLRFFKTQNGNRDPFIGFVNETKVGWHKSERGHMKPLRFYYDQTGPGSSWTVRRINQDDFNHWMMKIAL